MPFRFPSFIDCNDTEVALYVQVNGDVNSGTSLHIYLKNLKTAGTSVLNFDNTDWENIPQGIPDWVRNFQPYLKEIIRDKALSQPGASGSRPI